MDTTPSHEPGSVADRAIDLGGHAPAAHHRLLFRLSLAPWTLHANGPAARFGADDEVILSAGALNATVEFGVYPVRACFM